MTPTTKSSSKDKVIIADVDQVLLDFTSRMRDFVYEKHGHVVKGQSLEWDLRAWLQVDDVPELLREFFSSYYFGTLDPMPGAKICLDRFRNMGYKIVCLTSCGTSDVTQALRLANLFNHFGDIFHEVHFVEMDESKFADLSMLNDRYDVQMFIDDKPENIDAAVEAGISRPVLMKAPHNREERDSYDSVYGWYEVLSWYQ